MRDTVITHITVSIVTVHGSSKLNQHPDKLMKTNWSKSLLTFACAMLAFGISVVPDSATAALIWSSDFESYTAGSPVTLNATGDDNTFSSEVSGGGTVTYLAQAPLWSFGTGNVLVTTWNNTSNSTAFINSRLKQSDLGTFGTGSTMVLSFDIQSQNDYLGTIGIQAVDSSGSTVQGFGNFGFVGTSGGVRATYVANRSGSSIALPGTLGSLANGKSLFYYKNGGSYAAVGSAEAISTDFTGFSLYSEKSVPALNSFSLATDNFGLWTSASDTNSSTNVLELGFGVVVVPEPSTFAMLVIFLAVGIFVKRSRRLSA
jgi:hypothetical protein